MSSDYVEWSIILLFGAFGVACVLIGIIGGTASNTRRRKATTLTFPTLPLWREHVRREEESASLRKPAVGDDDAH
jgi:hypothetical protein